MLKWRDENREKVIQQRKRYYQDNAGKLREYSRAYAKANRKLYRENQRQWRARNPEKVQIHYLRQIPRTQKWRKENPVKVRLSNHRRREHVRKTWDKSAINILSQLISSASRLKCAICGKNMPKSDRTIDHVIPLSKGGTGDIWNLSITHHACNIRKNAKMPDELNFVGEPVRNWNKTSGNGDKRATREPDLQQRRRN